MKKVLVTGIAGQVCAYLAEFLLKKGYIVHAHRRFIHLSCRWPRRPVIRFDVALCCNRKRSSLISFTRNCFWLMDNYLTEKVS
ncbi:MAG: GDP-mannose 4,6-dehydratase [bacterium]